MSPQMREQTLDLVTNALSENGYSLIVASEPLGDEIREFETRPNVFVVPFFPPWQLEGPSLYIRFVDHQGETFATKYFLFGDKSLASTLPASCSHTSPGRNLRPYDLNDERFRLVHNSPLRAEGSALALYR